MPSKGSAKKPKAAAKKRPSTPAAEADTFPAALAKLLRARKVRVPKGLLDAPPDAYAREPASFAEQLADLPEADLLRYAEKIAGYAGVQAERAKRAWETSPLIGELRRRKLKEPARPSRVIGVAFSLKKPLAEWSNAEIVAAAKEWSVRGGA
jgi:hypothetical protein